MTPRFFRTQKAIRSWLAKNHAKSDELLVGIHKVGSGKGGITYPQALDEALGYGWIDGVRKGLHDGSYTIRFTPRVKGSIWSKVNIRHVERLKAAGLMEPAGLDAFERRTDKRSEIYSYESRPQKLDAAMEQRFKTDNKAWAFFEKQAPWYRHTCAFWVMDAKREETREKRLAQLIADSAKGQRVGQFVSPAKKAKKSA